MQCDVFGSCRSACNMLYQQNLTRKLFHQTSNMSTLTVRLIQTCLLLDGSLDQVPVKGHQTGSQGRLQALSTKCTELLV